MTSCRMAQGDGRIVDTVEPDFELTQCPGVTEDDPRRQFRRLSMAHGRQMIGKAAAVTIAAYPGGDVVVR
jgi:hypothetical protein